MNYDGSPLNKVLKAYAPGNSWAGNNIAVSGDVEPYLATENVRYWTVGYNSNDLPVSLQAYPDLFLVKQYGQDEKGKKVVSYTDRSGQLILKKVQMAEGGALSTQHAGWLCTYYVYDDFGQLRYTITPKAVAYLQNNSWTMNQQVADGLCYRYEYDDEGRATVKKSADKATELFVYDKRNRVVYTQDGNQRAKGEWHVTFHDELNRTAQTGLYKTTKTPAQLQDELYALASESSRVIGGTAEQFNANLIVTQRITTISTYVASQSIELREGFESVSGDMFLAEINPDATAARPAHTFITYLNPVPPINTADAVSYTALTYTYFDTYNYAGAKSFANNLQLAYKDGDVEPYALTKRMLGLATGSKVRVLKDGAAQFLTSTIFYDDEGRANTKP